MKNLKPVGAVAALLSVCALLFAPLSIVAIAANGPAVSVQHAAPPVPHNAAICAFVAQLEQGPLNYARKFDVPEHTALSKIVTINKDASDEVKRELFPWIAEAVYVAYATDDDPDKKAELVYAECTGNAI